MRSIKATSDQGGSVNHSVAITAFMILDISAAKERVFYGVENLKQIFEGLMKNLHHCR